MARFGLCRFVLFAWFSWTGQISWRAVGLTARAAKAAVYPNSRRKRQEGATGRVGILQLGVKAWPNPTAVQVGTSPEFYPGTGGTKNRSQEKELVSARYPQEEAQPTPYKGRRCWCCPPPLGRREENRCQERARAAGRIILDGLQEVPEERLEKNRPLDTSQWMSA